MKQKGWIRIFSVLVAISLFTLPVYAEETEDIWDFSGVTELFGQLPEGMEKEEILPLLENDGASLSSYVLEKILSYFSFGVKEGITFFLQLCIFILLGALFECFRKSFLSDALSGVFDFILVL